jgi:hypothetical protein
MYLRAVLTVGLAALVLAAPARAETYTVTNGSSDAAGSCAGTTCTTLRAALTAAGLTRPADTINVAAGTIALGSELAIATDVTINGKSARESTLDGRDAVRGVRVASGVTVTLAHYTIRRGSAGSGDGGGILNNGALTLENVRVTASRAARGGGIANAFSGIAGASVVIQHSLIDGNTATGSGGGIANVGPLEMSPLTLVSLTDSTVFRNTGGGVAAINTGGVIIALRSTLADNAGTGLLTTVAARTQVVGSIIARNTTNCAIKPTNGGANVEDNDTCGFGAASNPVLDTKLSDAGGEVDVLAIGAGSAALDKLAPGDNCEAGTLDQRGLRRPQGSACDAGAVERDVPATYTITGGPTGTISADSAQIDFSTSDPSATPECRLAGPGQPGTYGPCYKSNAALYTNLANGAFTFSVRDADFPSSTPATRSFTVAALDSTITGWPPEPTNDTTPTFTFTGANGAVTFQCRVDGAAFASCSSPFTTPAQAPGPHTFEVRALNGNGLPENTPAARTFTVDLTPPDTTITAGPTGIVASTSATFAYGSEPATTFECSLDNPGAFGPCPVNYTGLAQGQHTFRVRARDVAGNPDPSPAARTWTVDTIAPDTTLTPTASPPNDNTPTFTFTSEAGATFECRVDAAAFAGCTSPFTTSVLADGPHTFEVRARDAVGNVDATPGKQSFVVETRAPDTAIDSGPARVTNDATPTFTFSADEPSAFRCRIDGAAFAECESPLTTGALVDGEHTFAVFATDRSGNPDASPAVRAFVVDTTPPPAPDVTAGPDGPTTDASPAFAFSAVDAARVECRLDGPAAGSYSPCTSPAAFSGLAPGDYVFVVRSTDAAGNAQEARRAFSVTVAQQATPAPTPAPTATPAPNQTVNALPVSGTVLVKAGGRFVPLVPSLIRNGTEIDARKGVVQITTAAGEVARFYDGVFRITQARGITTLTLTEKLDCKKRSLLAAKKPKTRRLWGDGKGKFRTKGSYSAATVRGTKWLVQDTCSSTLTRVARGVVQVEDFAKRKKVLVKAPKRYTARAKKR